jgi:hypothetical protein
MEINDSFLICNIRNIVTAQAKADVRGKCFAREQAPHFRISVQFWRQGDVVDPFRNPRFNPAFGFGRHFCSFG